MHLFMRSKSRGDVASKPTGEPRDRETSRNLKWLSGISVGNWNLGLNFDEEELVNTSNAVTIDRSEPALTWKAQIQLARSKLEAANEKNATTCDSPVDSPSTDSSWLKIDVDAGVEEPAGSLEKNVSDATVQPVCKENMEASEGRISNGRIAASQEANFSTSANMHPRAVEYASRRQDLEPYHHSQQYQPISSNINTSNINTKSSEDTSQCVAEGCAWSQGSLNAGIAAKASQGGGCGPLGPPIGMPLNTPTPLSYLDTRHQDEDEEGQMERERGGGGGGGGGEIGDKKQWPPMSFQHSHTTSGPKKGSPVQKKHGRDNACFSSSAGILTDNGSSSSKSTGTWSLAVDYSGSSTASSKQCLEGEGEGFSRMNEGGSANNKSPRAPSTSPSFQSDVISSVLVNIHKDLETSPNINTSGGSYRKSPQRSRPAPPSCWKSFPATTVASHTNNGLGLAVSKTFPIAGSGITRLHYLSSYQPRFSQSGPSLSCPGQIKASDLIHNTPSGFPSTSPHLEPQRQLQRSNSHNDLPLDAPSTVTRQNPPVALTLLTTLSAAPSPVVSGFPSGHGASHKVGGVPFRGVSSPASTTAASPIEDREEDLLQPQILVPVPKDYSQEAPSLVGPKPAPFLGRDLEAARPITTSSSSSSHFSAGSLISFNILPPPTTPTTQIENDSPTSTFSLNLESKMAARSAAAQKSLKRSGAARDQYVPFAPGKHSSYAPSPQLDTAPSSSNSSQEFQMQQDIQSLQAAARQREQMEAAYRGRADSGSRMQGSYVKGHGKNGSGGNEILENVFGIYPEKKVMGTGVSVADVVANKLFKWGSKKEAPSTIPTPSREKAPAQRSQRHPHHPSMLVGGVAQQVVRPGSPRRDREEQDYNPSQRDDMLHSRASNLDQVKLDELMARQKLLEDRINQLKMERDHLIEANQQPQPLPLKALHEAAQMPRHPSYVPNVQPLRIPSSPPIRQTELSHSHSMSSIVHARQTIETVDFPMQFPLPPQQQPQYTQYTQQPSHSQNVPQSPAVASPSPGRGRSSRAFPASKHIQPLKTTPMAIPSAIRQDPAATSVHYASRPLPQPPIDATPPPEYEPLEQPYGRHNYRDMKIKIAPQGMMLTQDVILEEPIPNPEDEKHPGGLPSPRDDVDAEDILGWFETLKFASTGPRGMGPMAPLPRPEAVGMTFTPTGDEKSRAPEGTPVSYFDVKMPIHTQQDQQYYDMSGTRKDWNAGRKKRSEGRLRDYREDNMHLATV